MWTEASVAMSDLAWELFEQGVSGERVRKVQDRGVRAELCLLGGVRLRRSLHTTVTGLAPGCVLWT